MDPEQLDLDQALATSAAAREVNARGRLTRRQRARLVGNAAKLAGASALLCTCASLAAAEGGPFMGFVAMPLLVLGAYFALSCVAPVREAIAGRVRFVEGRVRQVASSRRAVVGPHTCSFPPEAVDVIPDDARRWRVYLLPTSGEVVGLELAEHATEQGAYR